MQPPYSLDINVYYPCMLAPVMFFPDAVSQALFACTNVLLSAVT